ncbi:hypothetical protein GCN78_18110 [Janthinobacterium rivuli]|uniref:hypothetical protein n=1 Tax=Janthinobacterium sp. FT68W TaxID=2654255 RepID=UPI00132C808E|nr:hypothetical protein [Janthinobacterium sp. FT68W]KAB8048660.1 hypothetical protein GCN78_18110 [Janthinobacterium sp. FT68W]
MTMDATLIAGLFGQEVHAPQVRALFDQLNTLRRPVTDGTEDSAFYDWVLVRRHGLELGFVDSNYHAGAAKSTWGHGEPLLVQAYFYSAHDDIAGFEGTLPYAVTFTDSRPQVRKKLQKFDAKRRSYLNDTWDIDALTLNVMYSETEDKIDRIAWYLPARPLQLPAASDTPSLDSVVASLGEPVDSPVFRTVWSRYIGAAQWKSAVDEGIIDLAEKVGITIGISVSQPTSVCRSITFHSNRDSDAVEWPGTLPMQLLFGDSPEILFLKIKDSPAQHADSSLTGYAVWHFPDYTLHVLYSNVLNRILRVKLISPGCWKCVDES